MIDYIFDVKPLQDQGISNANIAVHLNSKTAVPLRPDESKYILQDTASVLVDPATGEKFGSLISYYSTLPEGDAKNLIAFFLDRIYSGQSVDTSAYPRSVEFASVEATLPADLQAVCTRLVDEVGGGRKHSGVTEADVVASQQEWEASQSTQQEVEALEARYISQYNFNIAPLIDGNEVDELVWKAAIQKMADDFIPAE